MFLRIPFLLLVAFVAAAHSQTITLQGTALTAQVLKIAEPIIKAELGLDLRVGTEGGSNGGFLAVGSETVNLGMTTKAIEPSERAHFPARAFDEVQIGWQVLGIAVARDVWDGGVRALARDQMVKIYEGGIRNWKEVGGPDSAIKFYNPKRGRGTWELFVTWLYKDQRLAPLGEAFETVVRYEDARDSVEFNASSISVMPPQMAKGEAVRVIGIKEPDGSITQASAAMIASKKYPLAKPLMILSGRRLAGDPKRLVEFLLSPRGQEIVRSVGLMPVSDTLAASEAARNDKSDAVQKFAGDDTDELPLTVRILIRVGIGIATIIVVVILIGKVNRLRTSKSAK